MARLTIQLLGSFQVTLNDQVVAGFVSDKARALLAYLAVEADRPHRRESLAGLLWPESSEKSARTSLRSALANVRQVIGDRQASPPVLDVSAQTIRFNCGSHAWVDATAFTRVQENHPGRHSGGEAVPGQRADLLASAVDWYQGNFLEGFSLPDSPAFEEWALLEREYLQRQALAALSELIDLHIGRCEFSNALPYAWRQVELDPWRETAQRTLMRLLALTDQCEAALAQYRTCCRALADELGISPLPRQSTCSNRFETAASGFPHLPPPPFLYSRF